MEIPKIHENMLLTDLRASKTGLSRLSETLAKHHSQYGTFIGSNIEDLINVTAEIKQLAVELEMFVNVNYGKEVSDG